MNLLQIQYQFKVDLVVMYCIKNKFFLYKVNAGQDDNRLLTSMCKFVSGLREEKNPNLSFQSLPGTF